jgi:hypothetical protein
MKHHRRVAERASLCRKCPEDWKKTFGTMYTNLEDTRVSEILLKYGDIADVMEIFGVQRVGRYSLRMFIAKALTVEWAARVHKVPLEEFLGILQQAIQRASERSESVQK